MNLRSLELEEHDLIARGVGSTHFDSDAMARLAKFFQESSPNLMPLEDWPFNYVPFICGTLKDFFRGRDVVVSQSLYGYSSYSWKATNAGIETLILHRKLPSQKLAVYLLMPQSIENCEKEILQHAKYIHEYFTPDYSYVLLSLFREEVGDHSRQLTSKVLGSQLWPAGRFNVGEVLGDNRELFLAGWRMSVESPNLAPIS